jgi:hypothetical protein
MALAAVGLCLLALGGARFIIEAEGKWWVVWTITWVVGFFALVALTTTKALLS